MIPLSLHHGIGLAKHLKEGYDVATSAPQSSMTPVPTLSSMMTFAPVAVSGTVNPEAAKAVKSFLGIVLFMLLLAIVLWFVALYLLVKHWNQLPVWAKVLGVIGLIPQVPLGPIITIVVVLASPKINKL